jgi:hypothetical protein
MMTSLTDQRVMKATTKRTQTSLEINLPSKRENLMIKLLTLN